MLWSKVGGACTVKSIWGWTVGGTLQHYLVEKQDLLAQEIAHLAMEQLVESQEQFLAGEWNLLALKSVRCLLVPTQPLLTVCSPSPIIYSAVFCKCAPLYTSVTFCAQFVQLLGS